MDDFVMPLMLGLDVSSLTMSLVNIGSATALADSVEAALRPLAHLDVTRSGHTVVARTDADHDSRVVVSAHLDTAAPADDPLAYVEMGKLFGPGASDAKGALAVALKAAAIGGYARDVTFVFHGGEADVHPDAEFGLLLEPTNSTVAGDQLDHPLARRLIELTETDPVPDAGITHTLVSLGVPTVAFGPGDPAVAGTPDEFVPTAQLSQCEFVLREWLKS